MSQNINIKYFDWFRWFVFNIYKYSQKGWIMKAEWLNPRFQTTILWEKIIVAAGRVSQKKVSQSNTRTISTNGQMTFRRTSIGIKWKKVAAASYISMRPHANSLSLEFAWSASNSSATAAAVAACRYASICLSVAISRGARAICVSIASKISHPAEREGVRERAAILRRDGSEF